MRESTKAVMQKVQQMQLMVQNNPAANEAFMELIEAFEHFLTDVQNELEGLRK